MSIKSLQGRAGQKIQRVEPGLKMYAFATSSVDLPVKCIKYNYQTVSLWCGTMCILYNAVLLTSIIFVAFGFWSASSLSFSLWYCQSLAVAVVPRWLIHCTWDMFLCDLVVACVQNGIRPQLLLWSTETGFHWPGRSGNWPGRSGKVKLSQGIDLVGKVSKFCWWTGKNGEYSLSCTTVAL